MSQINQLKDCALFISLKILLMVLSSGLGLTKNPLILRWVVKSLHTRTKVLHGLLRNTTVHLTPSNPLNSDLISDLMAFYILDLAETLITLLTITTYLKGIHHLQVILTYPRKTQIP